MSKEHGHTKTLFIQGGKYKWSYKFEHCIICKGVDARHKGKGMCIRCFDKYRKIKSDTRKKNLRFQQHKYYYRNRVELFLEKKEHLKRGVKKIRDKEYYKQYKKEWRINNLQEVQKLIRKVNIRIKEGKPCMSMFINNKTIYLPFGYIIDKPKTTNKDYDKWKEQDRILVLLRDYYIKK